MSKDPAILFYTSDFLTGTFTMSNEQVGKYIRLLCLQHQKGVLTEKDMLNICETYDKDIFDKFIKNGEDTYYNNRMKTEIDKRKNYSESRRANRLHKNEDGKDMKKISKTYDKHMENENENVDINTDKHINKYSSEFLKFWEAYPRKEGKDYAFSCWERKKGKPPLTEILLKLELQKESIEWRDQGGKFIPQPSKYINQGYWSNEISKKIYKPDFTF